MFKLFCRHKKLVWAKVARRTKFDEPIWIPTYFAQDADGVGCDGCGWFREVESTQG